MAVVGNIAVTVSANTRGLPSQLGRAAGLFKGFGASVVALTSKLGPLGVAITGIAGAAGFGLMVKNSMQVVDANKKLSDSLGITLGKLAGYQHAADLSGVETDTLNAAMKRLQRRGTSLDEVAEKMAAMTDPVQRARFAFEQMGKSGQDLIPLLSGGSEALKEMVDEGERLSGLKGLDAKSLEEANDAITRAKAAFVGISNIVAITVAPALEFIAEKAQAFGETARDTLTKVIEVGRVVWDQLPLLADLAFTKMELAGVSFYEDFAHLFGVEIPNVIAFMVDNAGRLMVEGFGFAVEKLADNMAAGFGEIFDFIATLGEDKIELVWEPIGAGFEKVMADLPPIAERQMSDLEKTLTDNAAKIQANLAKEFGLAGGAGAERLGRMDMSRAVSSDVPAAGAAVRGSREAFSSIFAGQRGEGIPSIAKTVKEQLAEQKKQTAAFKKAQATSPVTLVKGAL